MLSLGCLLLLLVSGGMQQLSLLLRRGFLQALHPNSPGYGVLGMLHLWLLHLTGGSPGTLTVPHSTSRP